MLWCMLDVIVMLPVSVVEMMYASWFCDLILLWYEILCIDMINKHINIWCCNFSVIMWCKCNFRSDGLCYCDGVNLDVMILECWCCDSLVMLLMLLLLWWCGDKGVMTHDLNVLAWIEWCDVWKSCEADVLFNVVVMMLLWQWSFMIHLLLS
jgi:hypothetical protein